ncbi:MAG: TldD/PmbA family protein [archaeon]
MEEFIIGKLTGINKMDLHFLDKIKSKLDDYNLFWTINIQENEATSINSYNEHIESVDYINNYGVSVSLNDFNRKSFIVNTIDESFDINQFVKKIERDAEKSNSIDIDNYDVNTTQKSFKSDYSINPKDISFEEKKDLALNTTKSIDDYNSRFYYSEIFSKKRILNSYGTDTESENVRSLIDLSLNKRDKNNNLQKYNARRAYNCGYEITNSLTDIEKEAKKGLNDLLVADPIKGGKYNVVMDGNLTGVFMHEAMGHASEADLVLAGDSCLSDSLNKKIAPTHINLHDSSKPKGLWGSYPVDDDGFLATDSKIIDNGVMKTYISNLDSKVRLKDKYNINTNLTSNSRRQNYSHPTRVRMSNTYLDLGDFSKDELIEEIKDGFYLKGSSGGQVDTSKGTFQFSTDYGYLIRNGKIIKPVKNISFGGETLKVLNNIKKIGNKYEQGMAGFCGKSGQSVPVGGNNPSVLVNDMLIG